MKAVNRRKNNKQPAASTTHLATNVPTFTVTYHTGTAPPATEERYVTDPSGSSRKVEVSQVAPEPGNLGAQLSDVSAHKAHLPFPDGTPESAGATPAYEKTKPCDENGEKKRQTVTHMEELQAKEDVFLSILLSLNYSSQLLTICACGLHNHVRTVACTDCLQSELLCPQCWLNKHRTMPTHWALVWNTKERFFEKSDFCRVMKSASIALGHHGFRCPDADPPQMFTLVDCNGIHATAISFCRCRARDGGRGVPEFEQLLHAGIFPGSVAEPKTGYTLAVLDYYRQMRNQEKGSAYNFVLVLQRMADPFFAESTPDIYKNFRAISRFHQKLNIVIQRGHAHGVDDPLPGEVGRAYPNRPVGYMGLLCGTCPERGVNMPMIVNVPRYLRHLISQFVTMDGNFKANLFHKRDDGSDKALTDGRMYFPLQKEYDRIAKEITVKDEDKEVPCNAHIGSIRHQGSVKYGNTAVSGVIACACDHAVVGSFVDLLKGEAFGFGTYAEREFFLRYNSPPLPNEASTPVVRSYDSWCSFEVYRVLRARNLFPEDHWLHQLMESVEGQIPADHIEGHGWFCQIIWQAIYFACRAHFHGETAEVIWAFLNPLGPSTRQSTGAARHDIMNYVIDAWNQLKLLRQAQLLANERLDALRLFEMHMAVVEDLSKQHVDKVPAWSRLSRVATFTSNGKPQSVYQHESTTVLTIENVLASMLSEEQEKSSRETSQLPRTWVAKWIHDGMSIERQQCFIIDLLTNHREHPLQETWDTIIKLRNSLNIALKKFRETQREIYPRLVLSALDTSEPELTAIQLPSYRTKHGQREATGLDPNSEDHRLREAEIKLRCSQATNGILSVRAASLSLSAVKKARSLDYRGQAGITRSQRNLQKAEFLKAFEISMYNRARSALIDLGYMEKNAEQPYPLLTQRDTRRKDTHLYRARGDSRLFDGTAWHLQSGVMLSNAALGQTFTNPGSAEGCDDEPDLLTGTRMLTRAGFTKSPKAATLNDILPPGIDVGESSSSSSEPEDSDKDVAPPAKRKHKGKSQRRHETKKQKSNSSKKTKSDGWIWLEKLTAGHKVGDDKMEEYKKESDRVQWFRAEAEMYRWLEQYERKHAELMRVIERYRRDSEVWSKLADREEGKEGQPNGASTFARMQAAMYSRLEHNAKVIFKSAKTGAHHDWVSAITFDELVAKIDSWRDVVFKWMDDMDIHRAYKDF